MHEALVGTVWEDRDSRSIPARRVKVLAIVEQTDVWGLKYAAARVETVVASDGGKVGRKSSIRVRNLETRFAQIAGA